MFPGAAVPRLDGRRLSDPVTPSRFPILRELASDGPGLIPAAGWRVSGTTAPPFGFAPPRSRLRSRVPLHAFAPRCSLATGNPGADARPSVPPSELCVASRGPGGVRGPVSGNASDFATLPTSETFAAPRCGCAGFLPGVAGPCCKRDGVGRGLPSTRFPSPRELLPDAFASLMARSWSSFDPLAMAGLVAGYLAEHKSLLSRRAARPAVVKQYSEKYRLRSGLHVSLCSKRVSKPLAAAFAGGDRVDAFDGSVSHRRSASLAHRDISQGPQVGFGDRPHATLPLPGLRRCGLSARRCRLQARRLVLRPPIAPYCRIVRKSSLSNRAG